MIIYSLFQHEMHKNWCSFYKGKATWEPRGSAEGSNGHDRSSPRPKKIRLLYGDGMPRRLEDFVRIIYEHFSMDVAEIIPISNCREAGSH
jgi:hypothetical protein